MPSELFAVDPDHPARPSRQVAVVACMDVRLDVQRILGLAPGEAHVIRNAGGVITDDVIRSLFLSQRALGTREIVLLHHTDCGVEGLDEEMIRSALLVEVGERPEWRLGSFADAADDVRQAMAQLVANPYIPHTDRMSGYVYDVDSGELIAVEPG